MLGSERSLTLNRQIESGLTLRRRTENAARVAVRGRGKSSGSASRPVYRPGAVSAAATGRRGFDSGLWKLGGRRLPGYQFPSSRPSPGGFLPKGLSRVCRVSELVINLAGRSGRPQPVSDS